MNLIIRKFHNFNFAIFTIIYIKIIINVNKKIEFNFDHDFMTHG